MFIMNPFNEYSFKTLIRLLKLKTVSSNALFKCRTEESGRCRKRFTSGGNGQLGAFYLFIVLPNVDFDTSTD